MDILIYGAGTRCGQLLECLKRYPEINVIGIADTYQTGKKYGFSIMNILKEKGLYLPLDTIIVIAFLSIKQAALVSEKLQVQGYENVYFYLGKSKTFRDGFLSGECTKMPRKEKVVIPSLELHVTDFCNLNCAGCAHFSPLFEHKLPDTDLRINDLNQLRKLFDHVNILSLLGGEPLLNPEIERYMSAARYCFPDSVIQVITNGLLLPSMSDDFFNLAHDNCIMITISEYQPTKRLMEKIQKLLERHQVEYAVRPLEGRNIFNRPLTINVESKYENCCIADGCISVCEGEIARCPTLLYIRKFNERFNQHLPSDGIYKIKDYRDGEKLLQAMNKRVPLCSFCIKDEMDWHPCGRTIQLEDFAVLE